MADILFSNNASALLAATIDSLDTTIQVASGFGANFPSPTGGQYFMVTLEDDDGDVEVVKCTSRTGDNLTVVRAQEGTTAQAFTLNVTRVELRLTKGVMEEFLQLNGGTMTGALAMGSNEISGSNVAFTGGAISGVSLSGLSSPLAVADGGTGAASASAARTALGLAIGSDVQAYDAQLADVAGLTPTANAPIIGDGANFVMGPTKVTKLKTSGTERGQGSTPSDSTVTADPDLAGWSLEADSWYEISGWLFITRYGAQDAWFRFSFEETNTVQEVGNLAAIGYEDGEAPDVSEWTVTAPQTKVLDGAPFGAMDIQMSGIFKSNASTGGTIDFHWGNIYTAVSGSRCELLANSYLTLEKLVL